MRVCAGWLERLNRGRVPEEDLRRSRSWVVTQPHLARLYHRAEKLSITNKLVKRFPKMLTRAVKDVAAYGLTRSVL